MLCLTTVVTLGSDSSEAELLLDEDPKIGNRSLRSFFDVFGLVSLDCVLEGSVKVVVALKNCLLMCRGK